MLGGKVILACRDETKGSEAADEIKQASRSKKVVVRKLDLTSFKSIQDFATKISEGRYVFVRNKMSSNEHSQ